MNEDASQSPSTNVRLGIVEDDRLTRSLMAALISKEENLELVGQWGSAEEFYDTGAAVEMDLLLVDLDLPGDRGSELILKTKSQRPELVCMILTASSKPEDAFESLRKGASGYLVKDCSPQELIAGIQMIAEQGVTLSPNIARFLVQEFQRTSDTRRVNSPTLDALTTREQELLSKLAAAATPKDVAIELGLSYETVRSHLKKIYQKLHVNSRNEAVALYAMRKANLQSS